jgi:hypothetical protein
MMKRYGSHIQMRDTDGGDVSFEPDGFGGWKSMPGEGSIRRIIKNGNEYELQSLNSKCQWLLK